MGGWARPRRDDEVANSSSRPEDRPIHFNRSIKDAIVTISADPAKHFAPQGCEVVFCFLQCQHGIVDSDLAFGIVHVTTYVSVCGT